MFTVKLECFNPKRRQSGISMWRRHLVNRNLRLRFSRLLLGFLSCALEHFLYGELNALVARFGLLRFIDPGHEMAAQRWSDRVERCQRARRDCEFRRKVGRYQRLAWLAVERHCHFDRGSCVDLQLAPDLAVEMKAKVAAASRDERIFER